MVTRRLEESPSHAFKFPRLYDALLQLFWGSSEHRYRAKLLEIAGVSQGQHVLDVGCGTGTLALAAQKRVGTEGRVVAIDASPEMLARARKKASAQGAAIDFLVAAAENLPEPAASFDAVLSSTVLHCLDARSRSLAIGEMARVLKSAGVLLIADYGGDAAKRHSLLAHLHAHRSFRLESIIPELLHAGLELHDQGSLGFADLHFVLARHPTAMSPAAASA